MAGTASSLCEMVAHIGSTSQQGAGALTFGSGSWNIDPLRENLSYRSRIINPDVITGVLQKHGERSRLGPSMVAGQIIKNVSPYDLDFIFQMLGTGAAGGAGSDEYELTGTADPKYFPPTCCQSSSCSSFCCNRTSPGRCYLSRVTVPSSATSTN